MSGGCKAVGEPLGGGQERLAGLMVAQKGGIPPPPSSASLPPPAPATPSLPRAEDSFLKQAHAYVHPELPTGMRRGAAALPGTVADFSNMAAIGASGHR